MKAIYAWAVVLVVAINRAAYADTCVKAGTFNAALMQMVPEYEDRRERLPGALRSVDADFMCLNGIWLESDMDDLVDQISERGRGRYRHHWSPIHDRENKIRRKKNKKGNNTEAACSQEEMEFVKTQVFQCAVSSGCVNMDDHLSKAECVAKMCEDLFQSDNIDAECIQCLVLFMNPKSGAESHLESCVKTNKTRPNRLNPSGLMLISKTPISYTRYVPFFEGKDLVVERGFIEAEINGFRVVCTHLSANLPVYPEYDMPEYNSYEQQHQHEIDILLDRITFKCHDHLLLGDLNTGPSQWNSHSSARNLTGQWTRHYYKFITRNYNAPYLYGHNGQCTSCRNNTLQNVTENNVLDHILMNTRRFYVERSKRILDEVPGGPLSDNYGQLLKVCQADAPSSLSPPVFFKEAPEAEMIMPKAAMMVMDL